MKLPGHQRPGGWQTMNKNTFLRSISFACILGFGLAAAACDQAKAQDMASAVPLGGGMAAERPAFREAIVFFPDHSASLTPMAQAVLSHQARQMKAQEQSALLLGQALPSEASDGDARAELALARAQAVRGYLAGQGVPAERITLAVREAPAGEAARAVVTRVVPRPFLMN